MSVIRQGRMRFPSVTVWSQAVLFFPPRPLFFLLDQVVRRFTSSVLTNANLTTAVLFTSSTTLTNVTSSQLVRCFVASQVICNYVQFCPCFQALIFVLKMLVLMLTLMVVMVPMYIYMPLGIFVYMYVKYIVCFLELLCGCKCEYQGEKLVFQYAQIEWREGKGFA